MLFFLRERKCYFTVKLSKCFKHQDCKKAVFIFLFFGLQIGSGSNKSVRNMWRFSELFKLHWFASDSAQPFPLSCICKDHRMGICSLPRRPPVLCNSFLLFDSESTKVKRLSLLGCEVQSHDSHLYRFMNTESSF